MASSSNDRQLTEVLVDSDQNAAFAKGVGEDFFIPGILPPVTRPDHVKTGIS